MVPDSLSKFVVERAIERCEYCLMHQSLQIATFHIEHVIPRSRGGTDHIENLALACPRCNLCKSNRIKMMDPGTGKSVDHFNSRTQTWTDHFEWTGAILVGRTEVGRITVLTLNLNATRRLAIREMEQHFGLFPPKMIE